MARADGSGGSTSASGMSTSEDDWESATDEGDSTPNEPERSPTPNYAAVGSLAQGLRPLCSLVPSGIKRSSRKSLKSPLNPDLVERVSVKILHQTRHKYHNSRQS